MDEEYFIKSFEDVPKVQVGTLGLFQKYIEFLGGLRAFVDRDTVLYMRRLFPRGRYFVIFRLIFTIKLYQEECMLKDIFSSLTVFPLKKLAYKCIIEYFLKRTLKLRTVYM